MLNPTHAQILRLINQSGPQTRTELAGQSGLSKASISHVTAELIAQGLIAESETVYGAGRPSIRLALQARSAFFVGVSLATDPVVVVATDLHGNVVDREGFAASLDQAVIAQRIADAIGRMSERSGIVRDRLRGVGIAVPGLVDATRGVCIRSTLLGWKDLPIRDPIAEATGVATHVENDANALALGEYLFGALRGCASSSLISVGEGIGCGHVLDGVLHRGHRGGAGEIAHATLDPTGTPCACGKRGCLDTVASLRALTARARQLELADTLPGLENAAAAGQPEAITLLHEAGTALGLAIAQLMQSLDPERVVVAFPEGGDDGLFMRVMRQVIDANVMPQGGARPGVVVTTLAPDAWAFGAASVAAEKSLFRCL